MKKIVSRLVFLVPGCPRLGIEWWAYLKQVLLHNFRAVVYGEHNVGYASGGESLNLVEDHALVAELDQRLGESQGLTSNG